MKSEKAKSRPKRSPAQRAANLDPGTLFIARDLLDNVARRLEMAVASAVVSRLALSQQNADYVKDIATVLEWSVTDELKRQITRLDRVIQPQSKALGAKQYSQRTTEPDKSLKPDSALVQRGLLGEIRYRLGLVVGGLIVCRKSFETQNADWDVEIASMLNRAVIDVVRAQILRIRRIADERPKKGAPTSRVVQ